MKWENGKSRIFEKVQKLKIKFKCLTVFGYLCYYISIKQEKISEKTMEERIVVWSRKRGLAERITGRRN